MGTNDSFPAVSIDPSTVVGRYCVLGELPRGARLGEFETRIGANGVIRSHAVVYAGVKIGDRFQCGHRALIREHTVIGDDVSVGTGTVIEHQVRIANRVRIHSEVFIPEFSVLEEGVWVGPRVVLTNARYPNTPTTKNNLEGVVLERDSIIGANATLLPGVRVGRGAIVGAGSVVTKDVAPGDIVAGNPARVVRRVADLDAYRFREES